MEIRTVSTEADLMICKDLILGFSKNISEKNFLKEVKFMIKNDSLNITYVYDTNEHRAVAFVGFRFIRTLRTGLIINIDDLYTDPMYRGRGYGAALLEHVEQEAMACGISTVHLDSGAPLKPAQRLYQNKGFNIVSQHLALEVS
ncbi:GNAT family N-acetyltransferase [Sphingobacterium kitahiroshimense]|uniref:GNAT family N-acetyltransferase n=1 Tax=Sphingobacterium kitahiroshimense TaxID=470446 RepID=A0ABV0BWM3_9SPHI